MDQKETVYSFAGIEVTQTYYKCPTCNVYYNVIDYFIEVCNEGIFYTCPLQHKTEN